MVFCLLLSAGASVSCNKTPKNSTPKTPMENLMDYIDDIGVKNDVIGSKVIQIEDTSSPIDHTVAISNSGDGICITSYFTMDTIDGTWSGRLDLIITSPSSTENMWTAEGKRELSEGGSCTYQEFGTVDMLTCDYYTQLHYETYNEVAYDAYGNSTVKTTPDGRIDYLDLTINMSWQAIMLLLPLLLASTPVRVMMKDLGFAKS